ncbi:MAG: glycosyltransferase family 9 protein [Acidobacteria bacterium]|nr:glycosyltransferase family 9 protein [Acidobacteriota bacterium]
MRILVVRLGSLGDLVHTLPAVDAIRRAHPSAEVDWLVDAPHVEFLELVPILTQVVALAGRNVLAWLDVRRRLRARRYDVALDFQGLVKSAALARLSGATRVVGFDRPALRERAAAPFYSERMPIEEGRHVIDKNLLLATAVGAVAGEPRFPLADVASEALDQVRARTPRFALVNPGAAWPNKRWPPDRFGHVARWLLDAHRLPSIVLWGPGEAPLAQQVVSASDGAATLAPPTRVADLVAVSRAAALMLSGDTGPTHVAAAVGTPVVALFGPTTPRRNGPWHVDDVSVSRYDDCACHYERRCRRGAERWCLGGITEADVRAAIDTRLARVAAAPLP